MIVSRVWAHHCGRGIVDPPDQLSPPDPPSHPELLVDAIDHSTGTVEKFPAKLFLPENAQALEVAGVTSAGNQPPMCGSIRNRSMSE